MHAILVLLPLVGFGLTGCLGRGVGTIPTDCGPGRVYDAGLCYQPCRPGFTGVGPVCWGRCPAGFADHGATCYRDPNVLVKY